MSCHVTDFAMVLCGGVHFTILLLLGMVSLPMGRHRLRASLPPRLTNGHLVCLLHKILFADKNLQRG